MFKAWKKWNEAVFFFYTLMTQKQLNGIFSSLLLLANSYEDTVFSLHLQKVEVNTMELKYILFGKLFPVS